MLSCRIYINNNLGVYSWTVVSEDGIAYIMGGNEKCNF